MKPVRPEARCVEFRGLTSDQREGALRILRILGELAAIPWPPTAQPPQAEYLAQIDREPGNHVLLIDGGRGSGKTSLMVTVLELLARALREREVSPDWPDVGGWRGQTIVPLSIVDLQSLSSNSNLQLQFSEPLRRVVSSAIGGQEGNDSPVAPWTPAAARELPSERAWRDYLRAVALSSDGDTSERRARLDPEAYAEELRLAETQRPDVFDARRRFVDAVVEDAKRIHWRTRPGSPLFVLPVDDADLNPGLSGELVLLLRRLGHPRVVVLATADREVLREELESQLLAARTRPDEHVKRRIGALAGDLMTKVFPDEQVAGLPPLPVGERLSLLEASLRALRVGTIDGNPALGSQTLYDYVCADAVIGAALPERMRGVVDLGRKVERLLEAVPPIPMPAAPVGDPAEHARPAPGTETVARKVVHHLFESALARSDLDSAARERMGGAVTIDLERGDLVVDTHFIEPASVWKTTSLATTATGMGFRSIEWVRLTAQERESKQSLSPALCNAFRLARWLAYDGPGDTVVRSSGAGLAAVPTGLDRTPVFITYDAGLGSDGQDAAPLSAALELRFSWPLPDWDSLDVTLFWREWRRSMCGPDAGGDAPMPPDGGRLVDAAARRYLGLVLSIGAERAAPPGGVLEWQDLAERTLQVARPTPRTSRQGKLRAWALRRAGLMAAPESGLSPAEANSWLGALETKALAGPEGLALWVEMRAGLREERLLRSLAALRRAELPAEALAGRQAEVLKQIDQRFPGFFWGAMVEGQELAPQRAFVETLGKIAVRHPAGLRHPKPATLDGYLLGWRRRELERGPSFALEALRRTLAGRSTNVPAVETLAAVWGTALVEMSRPDLSTWLPPLGAESGEGSFFKLRLTGGEFPIGPGATRCLAPEMPLESAQPAPGRELSPVLQALAELYVDAYADERDPKLAPGFAQTDRWWRYWDAPTTGQGWPWPAVDWPAPYDWMLVAQAWRQYLLEAQGAGLPLQNPGSVDSLAYHYVSSQLAVARSRDVAPPQPGEGTSHPDYWISLIKEIVAQRPTSGLRAARFAEWRSRLALLAAPESGLQEAVADAILEASPIEPARLVAMRKARARELLPDAPGALAQVDLRHPGHPWLHKVGYDQPSVRPSPRGRPPARKK